MKKLKLLKKEHGNLNTVYDLEITDVHHYISANGVILHNSIGSFFPGQTMSGGGGPMFNASIISMLSKASLKDGNAEATQVGVQKTGIIVTSKILKNRFARPIPIKFHISFYRGMNPYVGLEAFLSWENCGIQKGKLIDQKTFDKWYAKGHEKKAAIEATRFVKKNEDGTETVLYFEDRPTARTIACRHLAEEIKPQELFTKRVMTADLLHELDEKVIKKTFMLPDITAVENIEDEEIISDVFDENEDQQQHED